MARGSFDLFEPNNFNFHLLAVLYYIFRIQLYIIFYHKFTPIVNEKKKSDTKNKFVSNFTVQIRFYVIQYKCISAPSRNGFGENIIY